MNTKKLFAGIGVVALMAFSNIVMPNLLAKKGKDSKESSQREKEENESQDAQGSFQYLWNMRVNPATGKIDIADVEAARKQVDAMIAGQSEDRTSSSTINFDWQELGPDNIGGRTRAILFDKNNPDHMFAGSVSGGLWYSNTHGNSWNKYNDQLANLAVSCITQAANGDIYFGTGEGLYGNYGTIGGGFPGQGVWKSTDGGITFNRLPSTWNNLNSTQQAQWEDIDNIAADPTNPLRIYVCTNAGLRYSNDSGHTWYNPVLTNGSTGTPVNLSATTVKVGPDGSVLTSLNNTLYFSSHGDSATYTKVTTVPAGKGRIEVAIAPSNPNVMYACVGNGSTGGLYNIYRTTDKFSTASIIGPGGGSFNPLNSQESYANSIAVAPDNQDKIFVAGIDCFSWVNGQGWNQISNWTSTMLYTNWVHADQHTIIFNPNNPNDFFVGCDGGLFESTNQGATFRPKNTNYNVTQFYSVAASPVQGNTEIFGGAQDNGTPYINGSGNDPQSAYMGQYGQLYIGGGDGGYAQISYYNPSAYFFGTYWGADGRSSDKGTSSALFYDGHINPPSLTPANGPGGSSGTFADFLTPFLLWENLNTNSPMDTSFFIGLSGAVWMTKKALDFAVTPKWYKIATIVGQAKNLACTNDGNNAFVGSEGGGVYRISNLNYVNNNLDTSGTHYDLTNTANLPNPIKKTQLSFPGSSGVPTSISVDPANNNHVVVTFGNYTGTTNKVYVSHNALSATPTFTNIHHNLPAMPVYSSMIDRWDSTIVIVGTEEGTFASNDGGATWNYQTNLPRVPVFMIKQISQYTNGGAAADIYVATHGRGWWKSTTLTGVNTLSNNNKVQVNIYPNPTADVANLNYSLPKAADVMLDIYNIQGIKVRSINVGNQASGAHTFTVNLNGIPSGTYMMNATIGDTKSVSKFVIAR